MSGECVFSLLLGYVRDFRLAPPGPERSKLTRSVEDRIRATIASEAALAATPSSGWLPIAEAPRDGAYIIGLFNDDCVYTMYWKQELHGADWHVCTYDTEMAGPLGWMPLPASQPERDGVL